MKELSPDRLKRFGDHSLDFLLFGSEKRKFNEEESSRENNQIERRSNAVQEDE